MSSSREPLDRLLQEVALAALFVDQLFERDALRLGLGELGADFCQLAIAASSVETDLGRLGATRRA